MDAHRSIKGKGILGPQEILGNITEPDQKDHNLIWADFSDRWGKLEAQDPAVAPRVPTILPWLHQAISSSIHPNTILERNCEEDMKTLKMKIWSKRLS